MTSPLPRMNWHRYIIHCASIREELTQEMSPQDRANVEADLRSLGRSAWMSWIREHTDEVQRFLDATPAQRKKRIAWRDTTHRNRLIVAGTTRLWGACAMIEAAGCIASVSGYREMAAAAARNWWEIYHPEMRVWPFDEQDRFVAFSRSALVYEDETS